MDFSFYAKWLTAFACCLPAPVSAQDYSYPPGTFSVDGIPVVCGGVTFVVTTQVPDVGMANPAQGVIFLNPNFVASLSTSVKLFWVAHECGHFAVGANETSADCWAVRTGRDQGWFPPHVFNELVAMFWNNPGDMTHPSGRQRVNDMINCYQHP